MSETEHDHDIYEVEVNGKRRYMSGLAIRLIEIPVEVIRLAHKQEAAQAESPGHSGEEG